MPILLCVPSFSSEMDDRILDKPASETLAQTDACAVSYLHLVLVVVALQILMYCVSQVYFIYIFYLYSSKSQQRCLKTFYT